MTDARGRRRVLIGCYFPRSIELEGIGSLAFGLASGMVAAGWRVEMLLPGGEYAAPEGAAITTYRPGILGLERYREELRRLTSECDMALLLENNPNMAGVVSASAKPDATFVFFSSPLQTLAVLGELGYTRQAFVHAFYKNVFWARFRRWSAGRFIVSSRFQADQLTRLGARETHVMPVCGVSRSHAIPDRAAARSILGWGDLPVVGYLGHFSPAKGVEVLIEAFEASRPRAVLAIAHSGKGRLAPRAGRALEAMLSDGRARLTGKVDPTVFLAACDVVALPYVTSSIFHQPQVLLESFAAGTPVITTSVGGVGELVRPGVTGDLVPPRDSGALAQAIARITGRLEDAHAMGRNAREIFDKSLCVERFVAELAGLAGLPVGRGAL